MRTNWILTTVVVTMSVTAAVGAQSARAVGKPSNDEKMDGMPSKSFALAGSANLNKHVGQKVSVTRSLSEGSMGTMHQDVSTLTIKSLKVIAKSCS